MKKIILDNRRITIRQVTDDVDISFGSCQAIFTDVFRMKHEAANIVLKTTSHGLRSGEVDDLQL